jgi:hypothetical protein
VHLIERAADYYTLNCEEPLIGRDLVTLVDGRTAVLGHFSAVTITIATARAVSSARQNSASERTTTRLVRWW